MDYALMNQHLYEGHAKEVEQMTKDALAEGRPVQEVLTEGLIAGMSVVGEDFKHNILYVPEVLIAARAMKAGMSVLKPLLSAKDSTVERVGVLLMGTVRGDLHDIGKNLVCMMAEGAGFEVVDIGVDQSVEKFMAAAEKCQPVIIGMSALLTTTMTYMKTVIDGFEKAGKGHIKMAVGGAPISQMFADEIGADGYGQNASAAVDLFLRLALESQHDDHLQDPTGRKFPHKSRLRTSQTRSRCPWPQSSWSGSTCWRHNEACSAQTTIWPNGSGVRTRSAKARPRKWQRRCAPSWRPRRGSSVVSALVLDSVGRPILAADRLSSRSSRLKRRLRAGLPAPHIGK